MVNEMKKVNADVWCLQEVCSREMAEYIAESAGYSYVYFEPYENEEEGLCIVSHLPLKEREAWYGAANAIWASFSYAGKEIGVVNLHLPWNSEIERERQIVNIISAIDSKDYDFVYMAGDFNCSASSDVARFLTGECILNHTEANPAWFDLAVSYAEAGHTVAEATLNFRENPRFRCNTIEVNSRYDRILLRNTYPCAFPILKKCTVFGQTVYRKTKLAASDHYGVVVEIEGG